MATPVRTRPVHVPAPASRRVRRRVQAVLPGNLTVGEFYPRQVAHLVDAHRKLKDHRLALAVWYDMDARRDVYLLEILEGFPPSSTPGELYATEFSSSESFPIYGDGRLKLTLVGPDEIECAIREGFADLRRVQAAFARGAARTLYCAPSARGIEASLKHGTTDR